ncbi:MAG TPA: glycosyltransferase family 1 protein [Vicinamibacterales bacterium]
MRVAIDARELRGQPTGVGRYLAGLLAAWSELPTARSHEFVLCGPGHLDRATFASGMRTLVRPDWNRSSPTLWEQLTLPALVREANADVLFAPGYTGPLSCPAPMVVAIHDMSFVAHPEWFAWREGLRRRVLVRLSARRAARIVTISQFSKDEIVRLLGVDGALIDVAYPGATPLASAVSIETPRDVDGGHLVLFVGSLFTRRHIPALIDGFGRLARRRHDVRLAIVGDNRTTPRVDFDRLVGQSGVADRIALRSYVSEEALGELYARARAFVFLSEYEGFGLTPVEALAVGVPIIVLDTPIAREVYGDAALYVPKPAPALVDAAIERALFDDAERSRILDASVRLLPRYSWRTCAEQVLDVLLACAGSRKSRVTGQR